MPMLLRKSREPFGVGSLSMAGDERPRAEEQWPISPSLSSRCSVTRRRRRATGSSGSREPTSVNDSGRLAPLGSSSLPPTGRERLRLVPTRDTPYFFLVSNLGELTGPTSSIPP